MRGLVIRFVITGVAVFLASHIIPGIRVETVGAGIAAALVLALLNAIVRPVLYVLSLPFIVLTLGLFVIIINAILLQFVDWLIDGFEVLGFWAGFWGALVISIVSSILNLVVSEQGRWEVVSHPRKAPRIVN
jgi:putative membrane protein